LGFGTIIAGIYLVSVLLVSFYVYTDSISRLSTISWQNIQAASNMQIQKMRTAINVAAVDVAGNRTILYISMTNIGETKITRNDFASMDILLTYTNQMTGTTQTYWCYYGSGDATKHRWVVNSTIYPNPSPGIINPLDWDPSEVLAIVLTLPTSYQMSNGTMAYLKVVAPEGAMSGVSFSTGD
jgi:hypothetical protein